MGVGGEEGEVLGQDGECDVCLFNCVVQSGIESSVPLCENTSCFTFDNVTVKNSMFVCK